MVLDRRSRNRLPDQPCRTCHASSDHVQTTVRTGSRLFFKCNKCGGVWDVEQPRRSSRR